MRVVVVGAGTMGSYIARELSEEGNSVYVIEKDPSRARELSERTDTLVVTGEALDPRVIEEAEVSRADLLLAVTDLDELNIVIAGLARELGVERTVVRVRQDSYALPEATRLLRDRLGIDQVINPVETSALRMFEHVMVPGVLDVTRLAEGRALLATFRVDAACPMTGIPLAEVREHPFDEPPLAVAVYRDGDIMVPHGDRALREGDDVSFILREGSAGAFAEWFAPNEQKNERVAIVGARDVGLHLAAKLKSAGLTVSLVDEDPEQCRRAAMRLTGVEVIRGRITEEEVLEELDLSQLDYLVAASKDEDYNLIAALWAKEHGARRAMVVTQHPEYVALLKALRVDAVVNPRTLAAGEILRFIRRGIVMSVTRVEEGRPGGAEVLEFLVSEYSPVAGKPLKDAALPAGCLVGLVVEGERAIVPRGDTVLLPGSRALVFSVKSVLDDVQRLFAPE